MYKQILAVCGLMTCVGAACMVEEDVDNNILANRIVGNWTFNADLTKLMGAETTTKELIGNMIISLSDEPDVLDDLPDDNCNFLMMNKMKIYLAGTMRFFHIEYGIMSHVYMLTSIQGQAAILYYAQGQSTPQTSFVSLGQAVDPTNDLLFYGAEDVNKPFSCLQRVERDSKLTIKNISNNIGDNTPRQ